MERSGEEDLLFEHFRLTADKGQAPLRVDKFIATHQEGTSRHRVQLAIKAGYVLVNDVVAKANTIIRPLDVIRFVMPYERRGVEILPEDIPLNIVFEDEDMIIIDKPAGMVVHPGHGNYDGTLLNALAFHLGIKQLADEGDERMGMLVHRIDKDTSGLLVVAKNPEAQMNLAAQFFDHSIDRLYTAVVWAISRRMRGLFPAPSAVTPTTGFASAFSMTRIRGNGPLPITAYLSVMVLLPLWNAGWRRGARIRFACTCRP